MRKLLLIAASAALLASCGKSPTDQGKVDRCARARGAPGIETDAQAQQACHDDKNFLGPDAKSPNVKIQNN